MTNFKFMNMERASILENIVKIRNNKGFTQEFIAEKIGLKQSGYGLIERGERSLDYEKLLQIALIFEMDVIDIITYPHKYTYNKEQNETKVLVEVSFSNQEFEKSGIKEKVLKVLNK